MSSLNFVHTNSLLNTLFFRGHSSIRPLTDIMLGSFVKIDFNAFSNEKHKKPIFGKVVSLKKDGGNSSISILYGLNRFKIMETYPIYNKFIKGITLFKNKRRI